MTLSAPGLRTVRLWTCSLTLLATCIQAYAASSISIEADEIRSAAGTARNVSLDYGLKSGQLDLQGEIKREGEQQWAKASLACKEFSSPSAGQWRCEGGRLDSERLKIPFSLTLNLPHAKQPQMGLQLALQQASFSDATGLHAGEKVSGNIELVAEQLPHGWRWRTSMDWQGGEIFWQPLYFASGGHALRASGSLNTEFLTVDSASLALKDVGTASFSGQMQRSDNSIRTLKLDAPDLKLAGFYPLLLKPLLEKTALDNLEMAGEAALMLSMERGEFDAFRLDLRDANIADKDGRFALYKINAALPWAYDTAQQWQLAYAGGKLLSFPLGPTRLNAQINRYALTATEFKLPIMDGAFTLSDVSAAWAYRQWHWHTRAALAPISMPDFSRALNWPTMQGQLSASIPLVTYSNGELTTDGALEFKVFNGNVAINNLAMRDPLGTAPRLTASMRLRNLDLGALTRTFSFGAIEGKLDGDVNHLQLVNWQPVQFDAAVYSSPGRYPKKISQRAVENISSLGGAGAAAAIQRSFLRFFDDFNYKMIGLSCRLRKQVCLMGGIESVSEGEFKPSAVNSATAPFVIVQGSGVPAITVLGYNHSVGWDELLGRLKRVTEGNSKPIIK